MSRKQSSSEQNKFSVLLKGLVRDSSATTDDEDLIDVEAEEVEDLAALPPAKARMLPPGAAPPPPRGRNKSAKKTGKPEVKPKVEPEPEAEPELEAVEAETPVEAQVKIQVEAAVETIIETEAETKIEIPAKTPVETSRKSSSSATPKTSQKPSLEKLKPRPWGKSRLEVEPVFDEDGNRKRGRPAKGKRSDGDWAGRTFYVRHTTDAKIESALWKLRREGLDVDKSDLADALLNAWAQVELGEVEDSGFGSLIDRD